MGVSILHQQEDWLRRNGLPLLIPARRRVTRLIPGIAPFLLFCLLIAFGTRLLMSAFPSFSDAANQMALEEIELNPDQVIQISIAFLFFLFALPASLIYQFWQRRRSHLTRWIAGGTVSLSWLFIPNAAVPWSERCFLLVVAALLVHWEFPSIIRWAGSRVLGSLSFLGPMIARVLPLLLLAQLLVFFTNEIWQLAYQLSRAQMWAVNGILLIPVAILIWSDTRDALKKHLDRGEHRPALLVGTPFEALPDAGRSAKLRISEGVNLLLIPMVAQLIQVLMFIIVLCGFFIAFGSVSLSPDLIAEWTGKPPVRMVWLGIGLPIDLTMFRVSLILATFSGLSFVASNVTDESYRRVFLGPIIDEMELSLEARHVYRGRT